LLWSSRGVLAFGDSFDPVFVKVWLDLAFSHSLIAKNALFQSSLQTSPYLLRIVL